MRTRKFLPTLYRGSRYRVFRSHTGRLPDCPSVRPFVRMVVRVLCLHPRVRDRRNRVPAAERGPIIWSEEIECVAESVRKTRFELELTKSALIEPHCRLLFEDDVALLLTRSPLSIPSLTLNECN